MPTVNERIEILCKQNNTIRPNKRHSMNIGKMISSHFKRFWVFKQEEDVLLNTKFIIEETDRYKLVVINYPESFVLVMDNIISEYMVELVKRRLIAEEEIRNDIIKKNMQKL